MPVTTPRLALNLFWRTFALLALLLAAGVLAWQQTFKALEAEPKALEAAQQHVLRTGTPPRCIRLDGGSLMHVSLLR